MTRWIPRLILITAIAHTLLGITQGIPVFAAIARDGVFDSVAGHNDRMAVIWFLVSGLALFTVAELARWVVGETGRIPARLGGWLLGIAVPGIVLMPLSGFWLVAVIGVLALVSAGSSGSPHTGSAAS